MAAARQQVAQALVQGAEAQARSGDVEASLSSLDQAQRLDPDVEISATTWNNLCWTGSLLDHVDSVKDACEQAVFLAPKESYHHGSRGLNRALLGDKEGALEDFEFAIEQGDDWKSRREAWVKALKAGENPFTPEVLEALRNELELMQEP
jgi:hypothetical protein